MDALYAPNYRELTTHTDLNDSAVRNNVWSRVISCNLSENYERQENTYVFNSDHSGMGYTHWFVMGLGQSDFQVPFSHRIFRSAGIIEPTAELVETPRDYGRQYQGVTVIFEIVESI